jgi:CheY-like chemotaxis protein
MENQPPADPNAAPQPAETASELNNLLQIISGTAEMMENIWEGNEGSDKYISMLRSSVDRAAKLTESIAREGGAADEKILLHPALNYYSDKKRPPEQKSATKTRILIVDDEPLALELAQQTFEDAGFEAKSAQSGFECLDLVRTRPFYYNLVLLDLSMPFMDGEETFTRLQQMAPNVAVMLNTGFVAADRLERMMEAGLAGFIRKPHRPSELVAHVRRVLQTVRFSRAGCAIDLSSACR